MKLWLAGLLLLGVAGCRYTFWPLIPPEQAYPERISINGTLEPEGDTARAVLQIRRWPEPDYLELRWYQGDALVGERSIWVEAPQPLELSFPYAEGTLHRLLVVVEGRPVLQLDLGEPSLPPPPAAPNPAPAEGSEN
ncbi:MAG TPA: hypothetical protein ENK37_06035 [Oceanithermus profundus]|uniref:Lipoprotein n=1 Tax=Oceanithermus profundus TaxID=187137 RepID=A0A7C4Z5X4_9DEIN|nr:hypothetical protein [Oceanithermus profundus]